jgi:hypothetical protein
MYFVDKYISVADTITSHKLEMEMRNGLDIYLDFLYSIYVIS